MLRRFATRAPLTGALFVWLYGFCLLAQAACPADRIDDHGRVEYVYDGDTLFLQDRRKIRLIAVNTPELAHDGRPAQPWAIKARDRLRELLPEGSEVRLRLGTERHDRHGRLLAHVFNKRGRNVSAALIKEGLGFAIAMPPNVWSQPCYFNTERQARRAHRGIWGDAYYRVRTIGQLGRGGEHGFRRIGGRIRHVGESRKAVWLDFEGPLAVRIPKRDLSYFDDQRFDHWLHRRLVVRGWFTYYRDRWHVQIGHPAMIETEANADDVQ